MDKHKEKLDKVHENNEDLKSHSDHPPIIWSSIDSSSTNKSAKWYLMLVAISLVIILIDIFLLKSYTLSAVIVVSVIALIIYTKGPVNEINYKLSDKGLYINDKIHPYEDFKSFGLSKDGDRYVLVLVPMKRFGQSFYVYFPEQYGEEIVDMMGQRIPMVEMKTNTIDNIIRRIGL